MATTEKLIIYQALVRLLGNTNLTRCPNGTLQQNGCGKMSDFSLKALRSIRQLGCNCVWYTGLIQQASKTVWEAIGVPRQNPYVVKGQAGSPYAISDYYTVSPDYADNPLNRMEEFRALVQRTHKLNMKVILDFVPNHVARGYQSTMAPAGVRSLGQDDDTSRAFDPQNNFYYMPGQGFAPRIDLGSGEEQYREYPARATGNDCFHPYPTANDWYETVKLNYGVDYAAGGVKHFDPIPNTWLKMRDILLYWCAQGVDGFRCDMAHMVPVEFWHWAIQRVKEQYPKTFFIAEIYDPNLYRSYIYDGGFDYLYDKVGLYDTLRGVVEDRIPADAITRAWQSVDDINDHMLNFLENHDEQRIASDFFAGEPEKALPALVVSALMRGNPFMIYFGQELGERGMDAEGFSGRDGRTSIFDYWALESFQRLYGPDGSWRRFSLPVGMRRLRNYYMKILTLAKTHPAFTSGIFYDLTYANYDNSFFDVTKQYAFLRAFQRRIVLVVVNFDGCRRHVEVKIPEEACRYVQLSSRRRHVEDLISGKWDFYYLNVKQPFGVDLPPYGAVAMEMAGDYRPANPRGPRKKKTDPGAEV
jgi:glycosidase